MMLETLEAVVRLLGGLLAYTTLFVVFYGIWRGMQRQAGHSSGKNTAWLRQPWFYFLTSLVYFGVCYLGWVDLPLKLSAPLRAALLGFGALLYFPGMSLALWARLVLGKNYFVSTGFGAQLFAGHQLVTHGPFAIVRHPMYTGLILAAAGSLLLYRTWTTAVFVLFAPLLLRRANHEEAALAAEFGAQWEEYCRRVGAFWPRRHELI
jgi:protein-S-isoprenylcysteine O-methyltransferase Ste14